MAANRCLLVAGLRGKTVLQLGVAYWRYSLPVDIRHGRFSLDPGALGRAKACRIQGGLQIGKGERLRGALESLWGLSYRQIHCLWLL
jgi:hypothetical protein